jgi:hypothetical protein
MSQGTYLAISFALRNVLLMIPLSLRAHSTPFVSNPPDMAHANVGQVAELAEFGLDKIYICRAQTLQVFLAVSLQPKLSSELHGVNTVKQLGQLNMYPVCHSTY